LSHELSSLLSTLLHVIEEITKAVELLHLVEWKLWNFVDLVHDVSVLAIACWMDLSPGLVKDWLGFISVFLNIIDEVVEVVETLEILLLERKLWEIHSTCGLSSTGSTFIVTLLE